MLRAVNRLAEFEDTQAAAYLLRVSFSIVRACMPCAQLAQWCEQASKFDSMIHNAIEKILGSRDDTTFAHAGLRKVVEQAELA